MLIAVKVDVGDFSTNCYIFGDDGTKEVVIIDPGGEGEKIFNIIKENNFFVKYIILTHGHFDHIGAVKYLKEKTNAKILIHELDSKMLISSVDNLSAFVWLKQGRIVQEKADELIKDKDEYQIGNKVFSIIHTPGHTKGGICILFDNFLFSGDTLFKESVGRTDLPGSDSKAIIESVKKLMTLSDDVEVFPGHGADTTIGHERKYNPYVNENI